MVIEKSFIGGITQIGRVSVSKTESCGFESYFPCFKIYIFYFFLKNFFIKILILFFVFDIFPNNKKQIKSISII